MPHLPLIQLVSLHAKPTNDAVFTVDISHKSTFISPVSPGIISRGNFWWGCPTPLCGNGYDQYHPAFVMAVLSAAALADATLEIVQQWQIPQVTFSTGIDVRRSMTLNAMRMSTELFDSGSERVFQLAQNRLDAGQTDVVHDLLVYLMETLLDMRRQFVEECALRAESIAAYLGLSPSKVLLMMQPALDDAASFIESLQNGEAGPVQRQIDLPALIIGQLALLQPHANAARQQEIYLRDIISTVIDLWEKHPSMQ